MIYTTSAGVDISIKPIHPRTLDDISLLWAETEKIRPPTYTVQIADGEDSEELEHDPTTLETDEDKEMWAAYVEKLNAAIVAHNEASINTIVTFGIDMNPPDDGWETDFEFCGISVPEGANERKVFYMQRVILTDPLDEQLIVRRIQLISRLSGEALDRADALFRDSMEAGVGLDSAEEPDDAAGEVAAQ